MNLDPIAEAGATNITVCGFLIPVSPVQDSPLPGGLSYLGKYVFYHYNRCPRPIMQSACWMSMQAPSTGPPHVELRSRRRLDTSNVSLPMLSRNVPHLRPAWRCRLLGNFMYFAATGEYSQLRSSSEIGPAPNCAFQHCAATTTV